MRACRATGLHFDRLGRCQQVSYVVAGREASVTAKREVVLCAGAIESPKVLLLSGIGDPGYLSDMKIPLRAALPGVGQTFHNHVLAPVRCGAREAIPPPQLNLSESAPTCTQIERLASRGRQHYARVHFIREEHGL